MLPFKSLSLACLWENFQTTFSQKANSGHAFLYLETGDKTNPKNPRTTTSTA
jgi:hypothetical protein